MTITELLPDIVSALSNKNPQVKEGTLRFLGRCLATSKTPVPLVQIKPLAENLATLLEDGFEGARNEAATCLGALMKMVGERPLNAIMENVADVRKAKVKEAFEKATVKCKAGVVSAPRVHVPASTGNNIASAQVKPSVPKSEENMTHPPSQTNSSLPDDDPLKKPLGKSPARLMVSERNESTKK